MTSSILGVCARNCSHSEQRERFVTLSRSVAEWDELLISAERNGMAPLLEKHLNANKISTPDSFARNLRFLSLRHKANNQAIYCCLLEILELFAKESIPCLVLKGAALAHTLYDTPGLRPMRDIDLMLSRENVFQAHKLLSDFGYIEDGTENHCLEHYHLAPLVMIRDGIKICVELHQALFPYDPPYYQQLSFEEMYEKRTGFGLGSTTAYTLAGEEMLYHIFQHGLRAPLTYEAYRLISVADIISLVEKEVEQFDWRRLESRQPQLLKGLAMLHYISPWSNRVLSKLPVLKERAPKRVGEEYAGWPRSLYMESSVKGSVFKTITETMMPGQWWRNLYYGAGGFTADLITLTFHHPIHLLRWVKRYGGFKNRINRT